PWTKAVRPASRQKWIRGRFAVAGAGPPFGAPSTRETFFSATRIGGGDTLAGAAAVGAISAAATGGGAAAAGAGAGWAVGRAAAAGPVAGAGAAVGAAAAVRDRSFPATKTEASTAIATTMAAPTATRT